MDTRKPVHYSEARLREQMGQVTVMVRVLLVLGVAMVGFGLLTLYWDMHHPG